MDSIVDIEKIVRKFQKLYEIKETKKPATLVFPEI